MVTVNPTWVAGFPNPTSSQEVVLDDYHDGYPIRDIADRHDFAEAYVRRVIREFESRDQLQLRVVG